MLWGFLVVIFGAGAVGGILNGLLRHEGLAVPRYVEEARIVDPGFLGNVLIGGLAAAISWGLYGPFANEFMLGSAVENVSDVGLTLAAIVGAILAGVGGARSITSAVDDRMTRAAGTQLAMKHDDSDMAGMFSTESAAKLLNMSMKHDGEETAE